MQQLTPEEAKVFWGGVEEVIKWLIGACLIWLLNRVSKSLSLLIHAIKEITELPATVAKHLKSDEDTFKEIRDSFATGSTRFANIDGKLDKIERRLAHPDPAMKGVNDKLNSIYAHLTAPARNSGD
jgi:hypothetical protein